MMCGERDPWVGGGRRMLAGSEIRREGGGKRLKGLQEKKVEDCSSYPFLLGEAYLLLIYIYISYIFNKSGNQYITPTSATLPQIPEYMPPTCRLRGFLASARHVMVDNMPKYNKK